MAEKIAANHVLQAQRPRVDLQEAPAAEAAAPEAEDKFLDIPDDASPTETVREYGGMRVISNKEGFRVERSSSPRQVTPPPPPPPPLSERTLREMEAGRKVLERFHPRPAAAVDPTKTVPTGIPTAGVAEYGGARGLKAP
ncbi:MAG TPA: hypothetical protein VKQ27_20225, partial [Acetobacteraceae bacterium]|nr:hypothetical protein [Acetobacteraceae bacterium]